jgi:hypothetical protein
LCPLCFILLFFVPSFFVPYMTRNAIIMFYRYGKNYSETKDKKQLY